MYVYRENNTYVLAMAGGARQGWDAVLPEVRGALCEREEVYIIWYNKYTVEYIDAIYIYIYIYICMYVCMCIHIYIYIYI